MKVPAAIKQNYARFIDISEALEIQLNRRPTIDEIAREMDITVQLAQQVFVSSIHYQSLSLMATIIRMMKVHLMK
ncbi:sigma-70 domain-containing protein [Kurthia populi]|uniref:Sigma-70 domain-containing protein n=1 Tax=Kurthia populi TaxID=1562132 RepID=A0ABW5XVS5_9BACL